MLNKMLQPFTSMISRLKYAQKFFLISMLIAIPGMFMLYHLLSTQHVEIQRMKSEQVGVKQVSEWMPLMLQIQQHRGLVNGYLNGNSEAKAQIEERQQEIAHWIEQIDTHFQKEEFPQTYEKWNTVKTEWNELLLSYEDMGATESFEQHSNLVQQVIDLIVRSADESGLTLDSDITSYYMMELIVRELPVLIEGTAVIRGSGNGVLASRILSDEIKTELMVEAAQSKKTLAHLMMSLAELDRSADGELLNKGEQAAQKIQDYLTLLDQEILNKQTMNMDPNAFFTRGTETIDSSYEVFQLATVQLEHTLQERINNLVSTRNTLLVMIFVAFIIVSLFYTAFYLNVMETVRALKQQAEAMAKGDFSQDIRLNTRDELQMVGIAFNAMQKSMNRVLKNNQDMALTTYESSRQLSDISQQSTEMMEQVAVSIQGVSEGTTVQNRASSEIETTMNEMSIGVSRIAEASSEVANLAQRANEHAEIGNQRLIETVNQMASIKKTQVESTRIVAKLDEHSEHISQIIATVMEVAQQTKLLALNANIEASRAGEHGRGFAVVAQEIGKLAEQTAQYGESISNLLNVIRSLVGDAVSAMDSMQTETDLGMEMIERSKAELEQIVQDIRQVSEQIQEVSATSEELSAEMQEVASSVAEISHISQETSNEAEMMAASAEEQLASMEQIQSSAEELMNMSQQLKNDLSRFVLREQM